MRGDQDSGQASDGIAFERRGHVGIITLSRPEKLNAWAPDMEKAFRDHMKRCATDPAVRVIVITGEGRAFCAGVDVAALKAASEAGSDPARPERIDGDTAQRYTYLLGIPKIIVCALNGAAAGVGVVLALYSDIRIAAKSSKLVAVFARRGLVAEHGIAWLLPRLIGHARAIEWLASARTMLPEEAERIGLVTKLLPDEQFREAALAYAADIAENCSPRSLGVIKRQLLEAHTQTLTRAVHIAEDEVQACIATEDFRDGVAHFIEKRPPRFTGR
jgi:enoyl-CoA hydratase/carnithine racemase